MCLFLCIYVHIYVYTHFFQKIAYPTLVAIHSILQSRWEQRIVRRLTGYLFTPEIKACGYLDSKGMNSPF